MWLKIHPKNRISFKSCKIRLFEWISNTVQGFVWGDGREPPSITPHEAWIVIKGMHFKAKFLTWRLNITMGVLLLWYTLKHLHNWQNLQYTSSESSGIDGGSCVFSHGGSRLGIGRAKRDELLKKEEKELRSPLFLKIYFCKDSFFGGTLLERPGGPGKKRCFNAADKAPLLVANLVIKISTIA